MLTLLGIAVVIVGFLIGLNPLLVVTAAAIITGLAGGLEPAQIVSALGKAFNDNRFVSVIWLVLPVIGLLERFGLQERARQLISQIKIITTGRLLLLYFFLRQVTAAIGLHSLGGHAQMVRPLIAPMAEAASEARLGHLTDSQRYHIRAHSAGTDNIGVFFGEDIFIAMSSILLIKGVLDQQGIVVEPLHLALWAIPTAIAAFIVHGSRLLLLDRQLSRTVKPAAVQEQAQ